MCLNNTQAENTKHKQTIWIGWHTDLILRSVVWQKNCGHLWQLIFLFHRYLHILQHLGKWGDISII
jgi:hypothetical protein